jgi:uncharacterized protein (TIGR00290 family)
MAENMSSRPKAWLAWSSGKDSAWALHVVREQRQLEVVALLTTVNRTHQRVAMHAVRESLLERQAAAADLPLVVVPIPSPCSNEEYERAMSTAIHGAKSAGVTHMIFGDLFLEDIRRYRESSLKDTGITPVFPLWGIPTDQLARQMLAGGLRSYITCVDPGQLDKSFAGLEWDASLLAELPPSVDPCGENGEFHTFAFAGPMFSAKPRGATIVVQRGDVIARDGFVFADFLE